MYRLLLSKNSARFLDGIFNSDKKIFTRLTAALDDIRENPFSGKLLSGNLKGYRSYRVGDYRIIYEI